MVKYNKTKQKNYFWLMKYMLKSLLSRVTAH